MTYANGFAARYEYDNLDRVSKIYQTENNTETLTYQMIYNGEGDLYELRNFRTNRASFFEYDHAGRCMASKERSFSANNEIVTGYGAILSSYGYQYDECNNLTKLTCSVLGSTWSTVYTYDADNRASTTTLQSGKVIENTFDPLGRVQKRTIRQGNTTIHETAIGYLDVSSSKTTGLVSTYRNGSDAAYAYTYDAVGNITEITQGTTSITYEYDAANRLIRENNGVTNQTIVYDYTNDLWGNIQSKTVYPYTTATNPGTPTGTNTYTYGNTDWGDRLTSYNGQTFTYDSMGNPTSYRGYTFGWRGKQLTSASNGTNTLTFEYNEDGLRQKKTVNSIDTNYFYNGSVLIGMQRGQTKYLFSYDASGNVVSVNYNGTEYYYLRNAQGDIVKLIDASGTSVVEYTYDTWGKKVTTTGSLAGTLGLFQPFRYRGYVYDWETGFYYLQSRYYDPVVGRFISADVLLSTGQGVLGHNAFAYCLGNPVRYKDSQGMEAGDCFDSEEDAIEDFYRCYAQKSKNDQLEYVTFLHHCTYLEIKFESCREVSISIKTVYYYEEVRIGEHDNVIAIFVDKMKEYVETARSPFDTVAMIHTHPAPTDHSCKHKRWWDGATVYCDPEGLSDGDIATLLSPWVTAVYAVLPDGRVYGMRRDLLGNVEGDANSVIYNFNTVE